MKNKILYLFAFACLMIVGCGEKKSTEQEAEADNVESTVGEESNAEIDEKDRHLAVLSPENILFPSQLKGAVEVVPEDDGNVYVDFDEHNYPNIRLTLKLIHQVPVPEGQIWLVGHAQDEKGRDIDDLNPKSITSREWRSQDSDGDMIKSFLGGDVDETVTFVFVGENNIELFERDESKIEAGKNTTQAAAKKFAKFKLSLTD
jgi:hypothetical protein